MPLNEKEIGSIIVAVPVISMMIGSAIAVVHQPSELVQSLTSSAAAGILIAAVAFELLPLLSDPATSWYAGASGFAAGILFFIFLAKVLPDPDEDANDGDGSIQGNEESKALLATENPTYGGPDAPKAQKPSHVLSVCQGAACKLNGSADVAGDIEDLISGMDTVQLTRPHACIDSTTCKHGPNVAVETTDDLGQNLVEVHTGVSRHTAKYLLRTVVESTRTPRAPSRGFNVAAIQQANSTGGATLPWTRIFVVTLDGFMDGLTLGVANAVGFQKAALIALAMTLEMCFVGVSLSCAIREFKKPLAVNLAIVLTVPLGMYVGFIVGAFALEDVAEDSDIFIAIIGFACAALLYLALIELIPESAEIANELENFDANTWLALTMFGGFVVVLIIVKFESSIE